MTMLDEKIQKFLNRKSPGKEEWLAIKDFLSLAENSDDDDEVLIYFSWIIDNHHCDHTITGVLVEDNRLSNLPTPKDVATSGSALFLLSSSSYGHKEEARLAEEEQGYESLFFIREDFKERTENEKKLSVEISQKITHLLELYYVPHKDAYCKYNHLGELIEVIRICISKEYRYIAIRRKYLNRYLRITKKTLVKYFNCWRCLSEKFTTSWEKQTTKMIDDNGIKGELSAVDDAVHMEGQRIYFKIASDIELEGEKKYETFKVYDRRHQKSTEWSCNPEGLCGYFNMNENDSPHTVSPVFFKEEVLSKYRNNPDKYDISISDRYIGCKNGGWFLELIGAVKSEGLVFVYLYKIAQLPHEEQLYWKPFNVVPPETNEYGGVPEEYVKTDFIGEFREPNSCDRFYEAFERTKKRDDIWNIDFDSKIETIIDENSKTWADNIGKLYNIFLHRVKTNKLKEKLKSLTPSDKDTPEIDKLGSVALFRKIISAKKLSTNKLDVLKEIKDIRNECSAHQNQSDLNKQTDKAKEIFGSLKKHYENLLVRLTDCLNFLLDNI